MNSLVCGALVWTMTMTMAPAWAGGDTDATLNASVRSALHRDLGAGARDVEVDSYGGTVRLRGNVSSHALRTSAEESAVGVHGVNHVLNEMDHGGDLPLRVQ